MIQAIHAKAKSCVKTRHGQSQIFVSNVSLFSGGGGGGGGAEFVASLCFCCF